jgi:glycosyltransferase involved in cell wall biosynthesis
VHAAALVESVDHVCVRYRLAAFRDALENVGHTLDLIPLARSIFGRLKQYQSASRYDAVILQRTMLSSFELGVLRRNARRLIFDFDDAIWRRDSYSPKAESRKRSRRFADVVKQADGIVAGNEFLAAQAGASNYVVVVPSCVNPNEPRPLGSGSLTLVWIGSSSTLRSLEQIRPTLEEIGRAFPSLRLKLICDRFAKFDPLAVENVVWSEAAEAKEIAAADIGIAWMPDDDWSRGKCGVKVLQYLAAGLPVISNPVGVHNEMVRPSETGFLAASTEEWIAAIRKLHDPQLRKTLGANGRRLVEDKYSVAVGAAAWCEVFDRLSLRQAC